MKIGELARRTGCPVETIRYYEREGLLPEPARSGGNYRLYGPAHLERLTFIRNCRALEMSLGEIGQLLGIKDQGGQDCGEVNALLEEHIGHVGERIATLQLLQGQLVALREQCRQILAVPDCAILKGLSAPSDNGPGGTGQAKAHVSGPHSTKG
jgi:Cd(II)/Pb(II)-responsive transcriptional regulator